LQKNIGCFYVLVEFYNDYALEYHKKLGYNPISKLTFIKIFFLKCSIKRDIATNKLSIKLDIKEPNSDITII